MPAAISVSSPRRSLVPVLVAVVMIITGCSSSMRQPTGYGEVNAKGDGYYGNFMYGCTGVEPKNGKYVNEKLGSSEYCKCLFEKLEATVPFDQVKKFEEQQAEAKEGSELEVPKGIAKVRKDCAKLGDAER